MNTTTLQEQGRSEPVVSKTVPALRRIWLNPWVGRAVAVALVVTFADLVAAFTPRGPVTTAQVMLTLAAALLVGLGAGFAAPARWVLLGGPVLFTVVFELSRLGYVGASIDAPSFGSTLGAIAFLVGRVFPALVTLLPLVAGTALGIALRVRMGHPTARPLSRIEWTTTVVVLLALGAMALFMARPASTEPIIGPDGRPVEGSVAELTTVEVDGHDLALMIRGRSVDNPVLLYLAGGPGGTDLGAMRRDTSLEQDFVVATWDQRGAGRSYPALDPTDTISVEQMVADTIAVTEYLAERFAQDRIYLVGQSWGSALGVLAVKERPDLYHAMVGVGQMVSVTHTDIMFWEDTLAWAESRGDTALTDRLRRNGPPPYDDVRLYEPVVSTEHQWNLYPGFDPNNEMPAILFVPEYAWIDRINAFRGFFDTTTVLYPQLRDLELRIDVPALEVPYYMVLGEHEARGRAVPADQWFDDLDAPKKDRFTFQDSGHRPNFDEPAQFVDVIRQVAASNS